MAFELKTLNEQLSARPAEFIRSCDEAYEAKISTAAELIHKNMGESPVVLLSGPSGSGKTTTALKIEGALGLRGIKTHTISMDNYFNTVDFSIAPRTPTGEVDYESPKCLDMRLLDEHFTLLAHHEEIHIPHFMFSRQKRSASKFTPLRLEKDEVAIFEGIHALNDEITWKHPEAFKLYVSARSDIVDGGEPVFKGTWMRLARRVVRDHRFRGAEADFTLKLWANVRRGEKLYISPFKDKADFMLDSSFPYEVPVMKHFALPLFQDIPYDIERSDELGQIIPAFTLFNEVDASLVRPESMLREFIGGGIYKY